jgi:hypothetical protein
MTFKIDVDFDKQTVTVSDPRNLVFSTKWFKDQSLTAALEQD